MTNCARPGCTGTIEDGFCTVCGLAPVATTLTPTSGRSAQSAPSGAPDAPRPSGPQPCGRPGCSGVIEDGFCTACGLAPVAGAVPDSSQLRSSSTATSAATSGSSPTSRGTGTSTSRGSRRGSTRGSSRSSRSSRRGRLGAGLVEVPPVPRRDPADAVMANPEVAERKRYCGTCDAPVGRGKDGRPGRTDGFCPKCGARYSFTPKLKAGDLVGNQYEVLGCIAHGGLGWIYLAKDQNVNGRWVVLKGLLDTGDEEAMKAAMAERRFLAEVEHPNIVKIYNFVQHPDPVDGSMVGYIVMEYVGGSSLKELRGNRDAAGQLVPLPIGQAIAYALEVLPAMGYLHSQGLLYCDFKPDNVIQSEEQLKLIDLGAVRRMDDLDSSVYKTDGYCAPELGEQGPSIESDLFTVARSLAVLTFNFDYVRTYRTTLPDAVTVPLLAKYPSYQRFLATSTDADPDRRFESAALMSDQLTGVLREVLATDDGKPRPGLSTMFSPERQSFGADVDTWITVPHPALVAASLPLPRVDPADPGAGFLSTVAALQGPRLVDALANAPQHTTEVRLTLARARISVGDLAGAEAALAEVDAEDPWDWRVCWYRGVAALAGGDIQRAAGFFDTSYSMMPGEAAPKLALGACHELLGDPARAVGFYRLVWRTDHAYPSAAFGLTRCLLANDDRRGALAVLESVPSNSNHYTTAQLAAITVLANSRPVDLVEHDLRAAGDRLTALDVDPARRARSGIEVLAAAAAWVGTGQRGAGTVLDCSLTDRALRKGMESRYRALAKLADDRTTKLRLVDQANAVRPVTWM